MKIKAKLPMSFIPEYGISLANYNDYAIEITVKGGELTMAAKNKAKKEVKKVKKAKKSKAKK